MKNSTKVSLGALLLVTATIAANAEPMKLEGTVTDVLGRRVVVQGKDGKVLVDLGPRADGQTALKSGDKVVVDGDMKKGDQLRARLVTTGTGQTYEIRRKTGWLDWITGKQSAMQPTAAFSADDARKIAAGKGYTVSSEPVAQKKHFVATAAKDGKSYQIDIHRDGNIVANAPFGAAEAKKLAADKGYTVAAEPVARGKHYVATGTKDGKTFELDLHRDGKIVEKVAFAAADARKQVTDKGYEVIGEPKPEKGHFQMLARKDGKYYAVDSHRGGDVKQLGAVDKSDIKWGPMIP